MYFPSSYLWSAAKNRLYRTMTQCEINTFTKQEESPLSLRKHSFTVLLHGLLSQEGNVMITSCILLDNGNVALWFSLSVWRNNVDTTATMFQFDFIDSKNEIRARKLFILSPSHQRFINSVSQVNLNVQSEAISGGYLWIRDTSISPCHGEQHNLLKTCSKKKRNVCHTHSSTSLLKGFLLLPRNSPIIWRLRPFRCSRKWATPMGVSGMKPREIRNWRPLSGFLKQTNQNEKNKKHWC